MPYKMSMEWPKVLIVEFDPQVRKMVTKIVERLLFTRNAKVYAVSNVPDALREMSVGTPFDLVITCANMPEGGGLEVIRTARNRFPNAKVILMSGMLHAELLVDAVNAGVSACVAKPFTVDQLRVTFQAFGFLPAE